MAQFCVYTNTNVSTKERYPFLLDIQNQLLDSLETRLVIPLIQLSKYETQPIKELMPVILINNKKYVLLTPLQSGIHKKNLGTFVIDISSKRQEVISALDFLLTGF
jgi:toxin CcdB